MSGYLRREAEAKKQTLLDAAGAAEWEAWNYAMAGLLNNRAGIGRACGPRYDCEQCAAVARILFGRWPALRLVKR